MGSSEENRKGYNRAANALLPEVSIVPWVISRLITNKHIGLSATLFWDCILFDFILSNLNQIIMLLALLVMSAVFSGCETALFSLKTHDLNRIRKSGYWVDRLILSLYQELPEFLLTILLGNMIVNILYFSGSTVFVSSINREYGAVGSVVFGVFSFCAVLVAGEIAPKSIAAVIRIWFARIVIIPIYYIHKLALPFRFILGSLLLFFERILNVSTYNGGSAREITALLELERNRGTINSQETELLEAVIDLPDIKAGEIMTPRVDVLSVSEKSGISEVIELAKNSGHNKIAVRSHINDEYIAWVDARDLFFATCKECCIADYYHSFSYISVYDRCDRVLDRFVNHKNRMGLVLDERGAGAGILVVSDVLGEVFGDFGDEEFKPEELITFVDDSSYILDGKLSIRDWANLFEIEADSNRSNTVGGMITDLLGRSALVGDCVVFKGIEFVVIETRKRRITRVSARATSLADEYHEEE